MFLLWGQLRRLRQVGIVGILVAVATGAVATAGFFAIHCKEQGRTAKFLEKV